MAKYTVLTYIMNDYEDVHEILEKDEEAEYLLITDNPNLTSETWKVIYDESLVGLSPFDKCYNVRFNCFHYVTTDICIRIDGSIEVKKSLRRLIDIFNDGNYDCALMPHPIEYNFIEEYRVWVQTKNYPIAKALSNIETLYYKGLYMSNYKGMFQCGISISRRGKITDDIDNMTYSLMKYMGDENAIERIDQIPFSYIMNKYFSHLNVLPLSEQIFRSDYLQLYLHKSNTPNPFALYDINKKDIKWMFNKEVECLYLLE